MSLCVLAQRVTDQERERHANFTYFDRLCIDVSISVLGSRSEANGDEISEALARIALLVKEGEPNEQLGVGCWRFRSHRSADRLRSHRANWV